MNFRLALESWVHKHFHFDQQPQRTPGKAPGWDLAKGTHSKGNLRIAERWLHSVSEQSQSLSPEKPGIFATVPLELKQEALVQLA